MREDALITHFQVADRSVRDKLLELAVTQAVEVALLRRQGVLVTRHGHNCFQVEVTTAVPFRTTREKSTEPCAMISQTSRPPRSAQLYTHGSCQP
ncbi:hypothetical protein F8G81_10855 [Arthrobacter sp. CDRTa11]|nr:hypothetical protein F8G81_10855 [Arthrobacter sp. CDRTa11]